MKPAENPIRPAPLIPRSQMIRYLKDREIEFVAHVQIAPYPPGKDGPGPYEDPYAVFDIDREDVEQALALSQDVPAYYADTDFQDCRTKTVILGKGLADERGHYTPEERSDAIDVLLYAEADLRGKLDEAEATLKACQDENKRLRRTVNRAAKDLHKALWGVTYASQTAEIAEAVCDRLRAAVFEGGQGG